MLISNSRKQLKASLACAVGQMHVYFGSICTSAFFYHPWRNMRLSIRWQAPGLIRDPLVTGLALRDAVLQSDSASKFLASKCFHKY